MNRLDLRLNLERFQLFDLKFNPATAFPVFCLLFSSVVAAILLGLRILCAQQIRHLYLVGNLFLAWIPLCFALALARWFQSKRTRNWKFFACAFGWLIFFPNAPYICTDLVHLSPPRTGIFWADLVLILLFAFIGLATGFLSLHLVHGMMAKVWNRQAGWAFVVAATGLSGLGIYIGRFLRWNSWDVVVSPFAIMQDLGSWFSHPKPFIVSALFAAFLFLAYLMFHAFTHLQPIHAEHDLEPQSGQP